MKIIIAALASIAFATSAIAAVSSAPAEKQSTVKIAGQIELAHGTSRVPGGFNSKHPPSGKTTSGKVGDSKSNAGKAGDGKQDSWE